MFKLQDAAAVVRPLPDRPVTGRAASSAATKRQKVPP